MAENVLVTAGWNGVCFPGQVAEHLPGEVLGVYPPQSCVGGLFWVISREITQGETSCYGPNKIFGLSEAFCFII